MNELPLRAGVSSPVSRALSNSKYMPVVALTELLGLSSGQHQRGRRIPCYIRAISDGTRIADFSLSFIYLIPLGNCSSGKSRWAYLATINGIHLQHRKAPRITPVST